MAAVGLGSGALSLPWAAAGASMLAGVGWERVELGETWGLSEIGTPHTISGNLHIFG